MKELVYTIAIHAGKQKVWQTMLAPDTYKEWVGAAWPGSLFEGKWGQGENLRFVSKDGAGTLATIVDYKLYDYLQAKHIAILLNGGIEDRDSDFAKGWIGTLESYTFTEQHGQTLLKVELNTKPEWAEMFNEGWPKALAKLKEICEQNNG